MPLPRDWSPSRKNPIRPPPGHLEVLRASDRELRALSPEDIKPADITYDNAGNPAYFRTDICKGVDLEWRAYFDSSRPSSPPPDPRTCPPPAPIKRVGFNTSGKEIPMVVNSFPILKFPTKPIWQYEISVLHNGKPETNKRPIRMCWNHDLRKIKIPDAIWDGHKIAWSFTEHSTFDEILHVTKNPKAEKDDARLDPTIQGEGHAEISGPGLASQGGPVFRMILKRKHNINLGIIKPWLRGKRSFDQNVIEALNLLDHLLRAWPSTELVPAKNAFFFPMVEEMDVKQKWCAELAGMGASVYRGIYQTIRPTLSGLTVNVDITHCVFYTRIPLVSLMQKTMKLRDIKQLISALNPIQNKAGRPIDSMAMRTLNKRVQGLIVMPNYEGCPFKDRGFKIDRMLTLNSQQYTVEIKDRATGSSEKMTVEGYFLKKYNIYLHFPGLPVVRMQTGKSIEIVYPLEFLTIKGLQRYPHMLDGMQTKKMIQFCATKPPQRLADVKLAKQFLRHDEDPTLKSHGMVVGPDTIKTNARLLPNPQLQFANKKINPGVNGRWDLRGVKFLQPNRVPLRSWGVGYLADNRNSITLEQTERWLDMMVNTYKMHGGKIQARPIIVRLDGDIGIACKVLYDETAKKNGEPQLLFVIVPNMEEVVYTRIKKSFDCRFGVPSQVLQAAQCIANRPQYHTNVLMKVNAKLGGVTARTVSSQPGTSLRPMGMIIGADVTHPAPGVWTPSLAAMSVSADAHATRYMGNCETNGKKNNEMIGYHEIADILIPLFREWIKTTGGGKLPKFIYYFRDGVSDSEYHGILNSEIPAIKRALALAANITSWEGKMCVVVANKRHHLRAFPNMKELGRLPENQIQDSNGNPLPGTLIDRNVCSPHNWDFFLYSHIALQGTARPVHYHVLADEMNHKADELEGMIYEHSYQYCRSSTSVSIHPAIYYAHLISIRARHHEDVSHTAAGPQSGRSLARNRPMAEHIKNQNVQFLLPIEGGRNRLATKMWYV